MKRRAQLVGDIGGQVAALLVGPLERREYVEWVVQAKQAATRERRIATAVEWMAEGKPRNWKYMR